MVKFFSFIGGLAIISLARTYQLVECPELSESEAFVEFWWVYLSAISLILFSIILQEMENESSSTS